MKALLVLSVLLGSMAVHAETQTGEAAKKTWNSIVNASVLVENSICVTQIRFQKTTCTLENSHASCGGGAEVYTCEIDN